MTIRTIECSRCYERSAQGYFDDDGLWQPSDPADLGVIAGHREVYCDACGRFLMDLAAEKARAKEV
jgi:hypothetical protein